MDKKRVLVVDDEEGVRRLILRILQRDFDVHTFPDLPYAMKAFKRAGSFALVISDGLMPGGNGARWLEEIVREHPDQKVLLISATETSELVPVLPKPFDIQTFREKIRELLQA